MRKFEPANPDYVGYPCSEAEDWWEALDQDEEWIAAQEAIDYDNWSRSLFNHDEDC